MTDARAILIVEDEPLIAMMLEDFLEILGYRVAATADTAAAALAAIATGGVDAAILDVNLRGGENTFGVAAALAAADIPFLFASGGSGDGIAAEYRDRPSVAKPFTMEAVEQALAVL
ncbi:MAG: response regulator [Pseudomonadota bacterium]